MGKIAFGLRTAIEIYINELIGNTVFNKSKQAWNIDFTVL